MLNIYIGFNCVVNLKPHLKLYYSLNWTGKRWNKAENLWVLTKFKGDKETADSTSLTSWYTRIKINWKFIEVFCFF